jgi:hypothetical protein
VIEASWSGTQPNSPMAYHAGTKKINMSRHRNVLVRYLETAVLASSDTLQPEMAGRAG